MKLMLLITAAILLPCGIVTTAWADDSQPVQPGADALDTQAVEVAETSDNESDRLHGLADQINQQVGRPDQSEQMPSVQEMLNLPEDTVIRGTRRGGVAIGTEF